MKVTKAGIETTKTVVIAILITGIVAFIGGVQYQAQSNESVDARVKGIATELTSKSE